ncbi:MAG: dienelactone hydrolase family protein [Bradyrhizobiaceae bacterium]|nr:dienelactone hydrolase family protein [Bradyrhizobiaceae bacterium]
MEAALKAAGKTAGFKIYPGAPHGFHADYRSSYREEAAEDAWPLMTAWFKKYGVPSRETAARGLTRLPLPAEDGQTQSSVDPRAPAVEGRRILCYPARQRNRARTEDRNRTGSVPCRPPAGSSFPPSPASSPFPLVPRSPT